MKPQLREIIRCPRCRWSLKWEDAAREDIVYCSAPDCAYSKAGFPILEGTPVLIDFERSLVDREWVSRTGAASTKCRNPSWLARVAGRMTTAPAPSSRNADEFIEGLKQQFARPTVLVIGGASVGFGSSALYGDAAINLISTDIYRSELTDVVSDGHQLPFADKSIDGVWIQAVLEHVLNPQQVVDEIHRVLADGGYVYAETPFMCQVHEGAFDFTRFTLTGHRWLFRCFDEVSSGVTRGPGTVLVWSIRFLVASLCRSYRVGALVAGLFFWLQFLDKIADDRFAVDGASGVFFLGRRVDRPLAPHDVLASYHGAQ
jgi:SAM-dependent methyltransferase/uncharacterized protein YbaR (Trm112 family)